jgi:hypothetical protein
MRAVIYLVAHELRTRWRGWAVLVLLVGVAGGAVTGLGLLAGLPLGIAAGQWSWALFAHGLGIPVAAITPTWPVLLTVPAVILIANTVALWPGRATARLKPAEVLRAE